LLHTHVRVLLALADHGPIAARNDPDLINDIAELCIAASGSITEPEVIWNALCDSAQKLSLPALGALAAFLQRHVMEMPTKAIDGYVHVRTTLATHLSELAHRSTHH